MYDIFYKFFGDTLFGNTTTYSYFYTMTWQIGGQSLSFKVWLCHVSSLVCCFVIFVLCCLFIWKIIKLIGGLIK